MLVDRRSFGGAEGFGGFSLPAGDYRIQVTAAETVRFLNLYLATGIADLGVYADGDPIPDVAVPTMEAGESHTVRLTFSEPVDVSGSLVAMDESNLDLYIWNNDLVGESTESGDEHFFVGHRLQGTYWVRTYAWTDTAGGTLALSTSP